MTINGHSITVASLTDTMGTLVTGTTRMSLLDLEIDQVRAWLRTGVVVFRGFHVADTDFAAFADRLLSPRQLYRLGGADGMREVDAGENPIVYHAEHGSSPLRPDVLWFHCVTPPLADGQTTVCDGVDLLDQLEPETRRLFLDQRLQFRIRLPRAMSQAFLTAIADEELSELLMPPDAECRYTESEDGAVAMEYTISAAFDSLFDGKAFANALLTQHRLGQVSFEDGSPIPENAIRDVNDKADRLTFLIEWSSNDVAIVDNSRMMHGRRGFRGRRVIRSTFGRVDV